MLEGRDLFIKYSECPKRDSLILCLGKKVRRASERKQHLERVLKDEDELAMQRSRCIVHVKIIEQLLYYLYPYWKDTSQFSVCTQIMWGILLKCRL